MVCIERCREIVAQRDRATTSEERRYQERLLDTAVEDLRMISWQYWCAARKRLKRMRRTRKRLKRMGHD